MGLLDGYPGLGGGGGGGIDLNQLVRPPDPLGAALGEISQRLAVAGQASRLPVSTLGALGSALGGASTAAQAAQTQYLDQAIKLQQLKRALQQAGIDERLAPILFKQLQGGGAAGGAPAVPGAPVAPVVPGVPGAGAPGRPTAALDLPDVPSYDPSTLERRPSIYGPGQIPAAPAPGGPVIPGATPLGVPTDLPIGTPGTTVIDGINRKLTPALGGPAPLKTTGGLLGDPTQGGPGAGATPASFRLASLVGPADGRAGDGAGSDLDLTGLLAPDREGVKDPLAGLLATDATIQPGGPDTLVRSGDQSQLPIEPASVTVPRSKEDIVRSESSGNPNIGYGGTDLSNAPRDPETGFPQWSGRQGPAGISHAAGKYQFQPGTWAEGARALGINDFSEASQDKVYEWTRAKYGDAPWRASEGGGRPGVQLAQYAPGGGQGGFPALVGPGAGTIPGLNMTPQQVAAFNALYGLAGHTGSPLKEFLDIYYKSPEYLRQSAQETEAGKTAISGPAQVALQADKAMNDIRVGMAKDGVMMGPNGEVVPIPGYGPAMAYNADQLAANTNKWQTKIEETKAKFDTVTVPILQPDHSIADTPMSRYDRDQKQQMQGNRTPQAGDIVGKPAAALPPGYEYRMGPKGTVTAQPIANTPEAQKAADDARARAISDRQLQTSRDVVVNTADRLENLVKANPKTTTGIFGSRLTGVWQPSADAAALIQTLEARTTLEQLQQSRAGSATGASGFGSLTEQEGQKLQSAIANLKQSQSASQFLENLQIVKQAYIDAVHGPGAYKEMSDAAVLKTQSPPREWKEGQILNYPDGSQHQLTNGQWIVIRPPTQR
jgi:hypothetical protein